MCLLVCFHVFVCLSVSLWVVYMSVWLCVWECICMCLPVSMYSSGSITWAEPQRERLTGPCVHSSHPLQSMVPSRALPGSRIYPPHQTSPHCLLPCMCIEKRWGDPWRTVATALSESCAGPPIKVLIISPCTDAEIESRSHWDPDQGRLLAASGTEEVRSWVTWLGSTHSIFWRCHGPPVTWVLRYTQRTRCWSIMVFSLSSLSFFRKIKAWEF